MPKTYDILNGMVTQSVLVGNLLVPASALDSHLGRFVVNLFVSNDDETYQVSLVGSATPLLYRKRFLLVCTRHQLTDVDLENVSMLYPDGSLSITSEGVRTFDLNGEKAVSDAYDIAAFDFTEPVLEHPE